MSKQVKYPIRVHITNNEEGKEPERLAFRVDGILFVGTRVEDKSTVTIYGGTDFVLSFYSEVANQLIKKTSANAIKDAGEAQASVYDNQRETDLDSLRTALLLYSQNTVSGNQEYVFPTKAKYRTAIVPLYISEIPVDPKTGAQYSYEVPPTFTTFTLKTPLDNPPVGTTGYSCNQDGCQNY